MQNRSPPPTYFGEAELGVCIDGEQGVTLAINFDYIKC